jgi:hypothetical protein
MTMLIVTRRSRPFSVTGSLISLAVVFGGSTSVAEPLTSFSSSTGRDARFIGNYSDADITRLDHATKAEATAARLAEVALGGDRTRADTAIQDQAQASVTEITAFTHSSRLFPLVSTDPWIDASSTVVMNARTTTLPGLNETVGVQPRAVR